MALQAVSARLPVVTTTSAAQGPAIMGTLTTDATSAFPTLPPHASLNPQAMASLKQAQFE